MNEIDKIGILDPLGKYKNPLTGLEYTDRYRELGKIWSKFPAYDNPKKIINDIRDNSVILVISGTGSGKTVLFPKYVLHALNYKGKIAITLPKQMIAKSAAEFSADTLDVKVGEEVGYQYRGSPRDANSDKTKLLYCTDGTLVARLLTDPELLEFDAVLIDEAHERKINIDFLLYLLRNVLHKRPGFKLIIMSATINKDIFYDYYKEFGFISLEIGTKTNYPIKSVFLDKELNINKNEYLKEGIELIKQLMKNEDKGGILFFVTSINETKDICDKLKIEDKTFEDTNICVPVFSGMSSEQQKIATDKEYFRGFIKDGRKIIIATNVAESSLTIEGISFVIDSGLELKSYFDPINRINVLEKGMITHAQAKQRMGRTGRTGPGTCYHLYTEEMFNKKMARFPEPSIKSESISYELLRLLGIDDIKTVGNLKETLNKFLEPPNPKYIDNELDYLYKMELITSPKKDGILTNLGNMIIDLQTDPAQGLTMIMAYRLNCFREISAILALMEKIKGSVDGLFIVQSDEPELETKKQSENLKNKFEKVKKDYHNMYGDHIALLKIFQEYEELRENEDKLNDWTYKYFIRRNILEGAYDTYQKMKYKYRNKLSQMELREYLGEIDKEILETDIKYRVMASVIYGNQYNVIKYKDGKFELHDGSVKNIEIEKSCFINKDELTENSKYFYDNLFRYGNNPIRAKIITKLSKRSIDIIKSLSK